MDKIIENNKVTLSGEIVSNFEFSHETYGEGFYKTFLATERQSETKDVIPVMVSERIVDVKTDWIGKFVEVSGQFRSCNKHDGEKNHLLLSVFAKEFEELEELPLRNDKNEVFLDGYICKQPAYRKTPLGREIADFILATNRKYGKSDYIPTICWGRNASFMDGMEVGTRVKINGRVQSREYQKQIAEDEFETRVAYEVSASKLEVVGGGEETE